ncbi:unnamed protein product [Ranitomeya imitator]|uniref:Uncharacterized protein n=1 Tax=Ranitomeya imitator TaxID=111125 RepID=A0ABN9LJX4_9NEOB|nr:unnamed protein product [Ranitomeya imitator]
MQKKCSQLEQKVVELGGQKVVLDYNTRLLKDKLEHYQGVAEKAAIKVAQNKYRKQKGKINKEKVYKSIAAASVNWDPDKWDGDVWDTSSSDDWEDPPAPVIDPPKGSSKLKANPIQRRMERTEN